MAGKRRDLAALRRRLKLAFFFEIKRLNHRARPARQNFAATAEPPLHIIILQSYLEGWEALLTNCLGRR
jgi:hypothetical protein